MALDINEPGATDKTDADAPSFQFWRSQLDAARQAAKVSWEDARAAWEEYLGDRHTISDVNSIRDQGRAPSTRYPIYWSSVRTIQPALYSRTPAPLAEKAFDYLNDDVSRIACLGLERLAKYLMRSVPYDRVQIATCMDFINAGKATNRVCFESEISQQPKKVYLVAQQGQGPDGQPTQQLLDDDGQPPPEGVEIGQDEQGLFYMGTEDNLDSVCVDLLPVHYRDILHNPNARHWEEIEWIAFRSEMNRSEVEEKFGKEIADSLSYINKRPDAERTQGDQRPLPVPYVAIWEIWNKRRQELYWICDGYTEDFLKPVGYEGGDPYELEGFFPCVPFMLGTIGPDNLYPVPDYVQLRPLIDQLHGMAKRLRVLVRASRRRGVYDAGVVALKALEDEADEAEFIAIENFAELVGEGGLENIVKYFPTGEIVAATQQMAEIIKLYEDKFNEIYGIPDILRGVSDPTETAAAQQLKGDYLSLRFSSVQREFQRLNRDAIELMCDLALAKFPEQKLAEIMGLRFMEQEEQQQWPLVLQLLRDDDERKVRIDIETDSTITMNQNADIEQRNYLGKTLMEGIAAIGQATQGNPAFLPVVAETVLYIIEGLPKGKNIEERMRNAVQQALQPQQPQPDPAIAKAQAEMQLAQQKAQTDMAIAKEKAQIDLQVTQIKARTELMIAEAEMQREIYRDDRKAQQSMQLEAFDAAHQQQLKQAEANLKELDAELSAKLQAQKVEDEGTVKMVQALKPEAAKAPGSVTVHVGPQIVKKGAE